MIPLVLDPARAPMALAGNGPLAVRRLTQLREGGADPTVYSPEPDGEFAALAGERLVRALPGPDELDAVRVLFVAGLDPAVETELAERARARRILVNVEDVVPLCDFHSPSVVRRGDLLLSVSTGGRSPTLARLLRERLEALFPEVWAERLRTISDLRDGMRKAGASMSAIATATKERIAREGWLP
ncbi:precorrin-2 dehydrogenase/sirohydrochlorin ferrochelatase family protein [Azospirillum agricola]|uniref:precorrin-2 dehydrogenase/sirohydrochlorin ferrochelatase family protein n=1 Tax=Azospirillum agricola TaxID=1720247 RepID=UPI000A0EFC54|nr:bifunctional precorrin-2 dehydrogenase/sirohydrochlorin ferrochelatase [Azospirillum agricola]SMH59962.1 precorrin-2 dehydrogenase / sirohydrochlorin ferrochelatase [Azospirillum lipoferum]